MSRLIVTFLAAAALIFGACGDDVEPVGDTGVDDADAVTEFDTFDADGDSYLDADEIAEWAEPVDTFGEWDEDADAALDQDEIGENMFSLWDSDLDGVISESEWNDAAETWYPDDSDLIVYSDVDLDGDSEIDADEYTEGFDFSVLGESWTADAFDEDTFKNAYFELYDADNDGRVSEAEWTSGLAVFGAPGES